MPKPVAFITEFYFIDFDFATYKRLMFNAMVNINERAGKAWIEAAVFDTPIPIWSGASRATFEKLASELGTYVPSGPPVGNAPDRTSVGRRLSTKSGVIEDKNNAYVGFLYSTHLAHLHYNEYNLAVAGPWPQPRTNNVRFTPYRFQARARDAWENVARTAKLPDPLRHLRKTPM